ncbi:hypothetical protein D9M71_368250 [compost metagenome]
MVFGQQPVQPQAIHEADGNFRLAGAEGHVDGVVHLTQPAEDAAGLQLQATQRRLVGQFAQRRDEGRQQVVPTLAGRHRLQQRLFLQQGAEHRTTTLPFPQLLAQRFGNLGQMGDARQRRLLVGIQATEQFALQESPQPGRGIAAIAQGQQRQAGPGAPAMGVLPDSLGRTRRGIPVEAGSQRVEFVAGECQFADIQFQQLVFQQQARQVPRWPLTAAHQQLQRQVGLGEQIVDPFVHFRTGMLRVVVENQPQRLASLLQQAAQTRGIERFTAQRAGEMGAEALHRQGLATEADPDARLPRRQALQAFAEQRALAVTGGRTQQAKTPGLTQQVKQTRTRHMRNRQSWTVAVTENPRTGAGHVNSADWIVLLASADHSRPCGTIALTE